MVKENERRRNLVVERLNQMQGINCDRPEGAIYVFPDISGIGRPSERIAEYLLSNAHVATIPGNEYGEGGETHLRICFSAVPHDRLELALDRIEDALMQLK
jgi:aspartate aminotransferase